MAEPSERVDRAALLKRACDALDRAHARLRELESRPALDEAGPIAIVGLACRFPGADTPEAYWQLLASGTDAVGGVPPGRWPIDVDQVLADQLPDAARRPVQGGFLREVDGFDADVFGISPREAAAMDPQHRLLLETAWDALDRAGGSGERGAREAEGRTTGVFVGITASEYGRVGARPTTSDLGRLDAYHVTGTTLNAAAGRLSYVLGARGPSLAVDTACSSSLSALHLACVSLRRRECDRAIAAGVHLLLSPAGQLALTRARVLSSSGRCRTFDAAADGMVRGEGCGVLVLRRLADAQRDGDAIVAVVRATAVNQDGASSGLTVPSGPAQVEVIRDALRQAGLDAADIGYVEAHGTATPLGDPIELRALAEIFAGRTRDTRLPIGSVKTNLGHLEAAAGMAGVIKVALALQHGELPPHLHFAAPTPQVDWNALPLRVVTVREPWRRGGRPRLAGVSAFGISGSNAHAILEEAPLAAEASSHRSIAGEAISLAVLPISARNEMALAALVDRYADHLAAPGAAAWRDICFTAATGRAHWRERACVVAGSCADAVARLRTAAREGRSAGGIHYGRAPERAPRIGFAYGTGPGVRAADVASLVDREPACRDAVAACVAAAGRVQVDLAASLSGAARASDDASERLVRFVAAWALTARWRQWGIEPWAVCGEGVGQCAAAVAAGVLGLDAAVAVVARGRRAGRVAAVGASRARVDEDTDTSVVTPGVPTLRLLSAGEAGADPASAAYWSDGSWLSASIASSRDVLRAAGCDAIVEIDAAPERMDLAGRLDTLARLYVGGARVDWAAVHAGQPRRRVLLPAYPWQRQRYWVEESPAPPAAGIGESAGVAASADGRDWTWVVDWEPVPSPAGDGDRATRKADADLSIADVLARSMPAAIDRLANVTAADRHADALDALEQRAVGYIVAALSPTVRAAFGAQPFTTVALGDRLGVAAAYRPLLARIVHILGEAGVLVARGDAWTWPDPRDAAAWLTPSLEDVVVQHPTAGIEARLLDRCGRALLSVMRGEQAPLDLLFPPDATASAAHLYEASPASRLMNGLVASAVESWLAARPGLRPRLLEIGAGSGSTTRAVLASMATPFTEYVVTDVSTALLAAARETWAAGPSLRTARLDIERDPTAQGFEAGRFDIVIAANVLHATRDLRQSLTNAARLVAPDGVLVVLEGTTPVRLIDLVFGLTPGWWRFEDRALRPDHPLVGVPRWRDLLVGAGFADVAVVGDRAGDRGVLSRQAVIAARRAAVAEPALVPDRTEPSRPGDVRRALVLDDRVGWGRRAHAALEAAGEHATLVPHDADAEAAVRDALRIAAHGDILDIVDFRALDTPPAAAVPVDEAQAAAERAIGRALALARILAEAPLVECRLRLVTRGALSIFGEAPQGLLQSPLWGIGKVIPLEHPAIRTCLIDLDPHGDTSALDAAGQSSASWARLLRDVDEPLLAVRRERLWCARLVADTPRASDTPLAFDRDGAWIVTGGLGGLGLLVAEQLLTRGAAQVVLVGRHQPSASAAATLARLDPAGRRLRVAQGDVSDVARLRRILDDVREGGRPIVGVVHAAGLLDDGVLLQVDAARLSRGLRAKVQGAWNLHVATARDPVQHFVLFSAATSLFGSAGQVTHAAGNAFLDALAGYRRAQGLAALALNWGAWSTVGAASGETVASRVRMKGLLPIEPARGLALLERLMQSGWSQAGVFAADWAHAPAGLDRHPLIASLVDRARETDARSDVTRSAGEPSLRSRLAGATDDRRRMLVTQLVRDEVGRVLGLPPASRLDTARGFFDLGIDSLSSTDLRNRLQSQLALALPASLIFDHPTPDALVSALLERLEVRDPPAQGDRHTVAAREGDDLVDQLSRKLAELREAGA